MVDYQRSTKMEFRKHSFIYLTLTLQLCNQILCIQYTPVDIGDITDCALVLPKPAQYSADLLRSDFGGPVNCITYDAINQAYLDARKRIDIPTVEDDWKSEEVAAVGQLLLDVSQQLTREFNLNVEDIEIGLPQIATFKTAIRDVCPVYLSSISCRAGKYRRHDGLCNNVNQPTWGATMTPFTRLLPPQFADHISAPRISITGKPLPSARVVSRTVHPDEGYHDHAGTTMTVAWGQFMDHDFTLMGTPLDSRNRNEPEECCYRPDHLKNPYCMEITVSEDDYFYNKFNVRCQDFVRAFPAIQPNCRLGSRNPFNTLTGVIDGNTVYGVKEHFARQLRAGTGGLLKMNPAFDVLGLKDLLPLKTDIPDEGCIRTNSSQYCFLAGEIRVNEQLILTCIHTLMAREHNRIAQELAVINLHWDDEILYQEARRIVIAEIQHITYNEFLPLILGKEVMGKYGLLLNTEGYWDGYSPQINPNILDAFSAAAFRFGHSLLPSSIERWSKLHKFIASKRLSDVIRRPYDLYRAGVLDEYFTGMLNQVAQAMDDSVTQEVTNNLFKKSGNRFGLDLVSFNIQRGRDFGLPGYMYFRKHCGLKTADSFAEMFEMMSNSTIHRYMSIYEHPWDIDLWSGGVSENPLPGSLVGPTFACIIATQMNLVRRGDRFWYELPNQPSSFTPEQLQEIRKIKLSRVLCDNSDLLDTVQIYAMVLPDHDINPRVPCKSSILPKMDLSLWADTPTRSFDDKINQPTLIIKNPTSNANQSAPLYEYHVKTIAIIEGAAAPININDFLSSNSDYNYRPSSSISREDSDYDHKIYKRDINVTADALPSGINDKKEITKRQSYYSQHQKPFSGRGMTRAIIREDNSPFRNHPASHLESNNIEGFFRKNVPIYDGISSSRVNRYRGSNFRPHSFYKSQKQEDEDEEEEDKEKPLSLEEVDPDHESQHEHVPMTMDEFGKQKVMDTFDEMPDYHSKHSFPKFHSHSEHYRKSPFQNSFSKPTSYPHSFDHSAFRSQERNPDIFSHAQSEFGTSRQYNSLADDHPRYYKHFPSTFSNQPLYSTPSDERPFPHPTSSPYSEHPPLPQYNDYDFSSDGEAISRRPSNQAFRTTVPQTLEEYHRIHNTFGNMKVNPRRGYNSRFDSHRNSPVTVPQDDAGEEEDEKEEKDDKDDKEEADEKDESPSGPKSFVSMNFKIFGHGDDDDDNGISVRHEIGHSGPRFQSHRTPSETKDVEYPTLPVVRSSETLQEPARFKENSEKIKSFVDSIFTKNKAIEQQQGYRSSVGRDSKENGDAPSLYNPNFGDRVKTESRPPQNFLWHRRPASTRDRGFRGSLGRDKMVLQDTVNLKSFSNFNKDVNRQSKRNAEKNNCTEFESSVEEVKENEPMASVPEMNKESRDEDKSQDFYWSESFAEPNK